MQTRHALAAVSVAVLALAVAAPAAAKDPKPDQKKEQCFYARDVNGFAAPDEHTLYVRVGVRDVYKFEMMGTCPDINWNERLALVSQPSSWICNGMDATVITHSTGIGPQRCPVRSVAKLTPEEVAALPKKSRP